MILPDLTYLSSRRYVVDWDSNLPTFDLFISAYNESERVKSVYQKISALEKLWVVVPEYDYTEDEVSQLPNKIYCPKGESESDVVRRLMSHAQDGTDQRLRTLGVDITGFMRPQLLFLMRELWDRGIEKVCMLYSEPEKYARQEHTAFADEEIATVRQVHGYEGTHLNEMESDVLVIGVGYDDALISRVVNDKDSAKVIEMRGLPSLSADMYQESILRLDRTGINTVEPIFASANDPFVIAHELSVRISEMREDGSVGNLYLCPLATKPQALGFGLFFLNELQDEAASVIFPYSASYSKETSTGVGRTWVYELAFGEWKSDEWRHKVPDGGGK